MLCLTFLVLAAVAGTVNGFVCFPDNEVRSSTGLGVVMGEDALTQTGISRREAWSTAQRVVVAGAATSSGLVLPPTAGAQTMSPRSTATKIPTVRLGGGTLEVSRTIQGCWQLAGGHGQYRESDALANMEAHFNAGVTTLDTADIYGPSELVVGKFLRSQPKAIPCTKFCCFRYLEEIDQDEVRLRIQKVRCGQRGG